MSGWIGVDLDGTLAKYTGWQGVAVIGEPVPEMVERVKRWLANGREVRIFTARVWHPAEPQGVNPKSPEMAEYVGRKLEADIAREAIKRWCKEHVGVELPITNVKDYGMIELWDDRAVQVVPNTGRMVGQSTRGL
jgi:hypothetical protein